MNNGKTNINPLRLNEINTEPERILFFVFLIVGIVLSHYGEKIYLGIGSWEEWTQDGTEIVTNSYSDFVTDLGFILYEIGYVIQANYYVFLLIIVIKLILVNTKEIENNKSINTNTY